MLNLLHSTFLGGPLHNADVSFLLRENQQEMLSIDSQLPLIPASNMKIVISAAALLCGEEDLFPHLLTFANGSIKDGQLNGDLILDSCGTLTFSARFPVTQTIQQRQLLLDDQVAVFAQNLRENGIERVQGDLKLISNRWSGDPDNSHYTASTAFSFNENTLDTMVKSGQYLTCPADPLIFKSSPDSSVKSQKKVEDNRILFNPDKDSQDYWRISHFSGVEYSRQMLKKALGKQGIKFLHQKTSPAENTILFETPSLYSLAEFIQPMNSWSDNARAELLALCLTRKVSGAADYALLDKSLKEIFADAGLKLTSLQAADGSGLSRHNRISSADLTAILDKLSESPYCEDFKNSLAHAGQSGTLRKRFKDSFFEDRLKAKTGTLNGVSSLSGYFDNQGKNYTFSLLCNGAKNKDIWQAIEKFSDSLFFLQ
ncbi:MAG: D-alanyl-D-alanine carboxypeptidase/D-alanyl-D-alanine-endopeptidase [Lentisphaeraceae bacterium]|nr:D-alanyl-D-alanine carboxypeptidase/D-alanyl-D-alanine-endopeptidase [Lentisphaeraceae bacterium]